MNSWICENNECFERANPVPPPLSRQSANLEMVSDQPMTCSVCGVLINVIRDEPVSDE